MTKKKTRHRPGKAAKAWFAKCNSYTDRSAEWAYMDRVSRIARWVIGGFGRRMP
ncbi:MAG: hypothetical protein IKO01_09235 [Kiritimatiellae bacterium]|nr:hypothetical protein [Kiritimatiellia bacterium]